MFLYTSLLTNYLLKPLRFSNNMTGIFIRKFLKGTERVEISSEKVCKVKFSELFWPNIFYTPKYTHDIAHTAPCAWNRCSYSLYSSLFLFSFSLSLSLLSFCSLLIFQALLIYHQPSSTFPFISYKLTVIVPISEHI